MTGRFRLEGARALYATFSELPRSVQRNVLDRTLRGVAGPFTARVRARAPYFIGVLQEHTAQGPYRSLTSRQKRFERQDRGKFEATIHIGTADPAGMMNEFGNVNMSPQPYFRAEWEASKLALLRGIEQSLGGEIMAGAARVAKRSARRG